MKTFKLALLMILISTTGLYAQTAYNPFTQNIHFEPEPTAQGFECGSTPNVEFTQGITTAEDATLWQTQPLIVTICITGFDFDGATAASVVSGSYSTNFTWAFDAFAPGCIVGTQSQTLPGTGTNPLNPNPLSSGDINLALTVPATSPISTVLAVNVNLQVPGYMSQFNSTPDDNESTQTQTFCNLSISGGLYLDTNQNNGVIETGNPLGTLEGTPMYVNLVDPSGNVADVVLLDATGQYEFTNVTGNTVYTVVLSETQGTVGTPAPAPSVPAINGWSNTADDCCDGSGADGNPDGIITVSVTNASAVLANFGVWDATPTGPQGPLPVNMSHFSLSEYNCNTLVAWSTASEESVSHFDVLRKSPGSDQFVKIAKINATGNSNSQKLYSYLDKDVEKNSVSYLYKIETVDLDRSVAVSPVESIKLTCEGDEASVQLFPNPASDNINLVYTTVENDIQLVVDVLDITGRKLLSTSQIVYKGTSVVNMNIKSLAVGQYLIRYHSLEGNTTSTIKFTKE